MMVYITGYFYIRNNLQVMRKKKSFVDDFLTTFQALHGYHI